MGMKLSQRLEYYWWHPYQRLGIAGLWGRRWWWWWWWRCSSEDEEGWKKRGGRRKGKPFLTASWQELQVVHYTRIEKEEEGYTSKHRMITLSFLSHFFLTGGRGCFLPNSRRPKTCIKISVPNKSSYLQKKSCFFKMLPWIKEERI